MSNLNPLYKVVVSTPECWICLGEDEAQNLISLECACRNFVHPKCAQTWFCETKKSNVCDICKVNMREPGAENMLFRARFARVAIMMFTTADAIDAAATHRGLR